MLHVVFGKTAMVTVAFAIGWSGVGVVSVSVPDTVTGLPYVLVEGDTLAVMPVLSGGSNCVDAVEPEARPVPVTAYRPPTVTLSTNWYVKLPCVSVAGAPWSTTCETGSVVTTSTVSPAA